MSVFPGIHSRPDFVTFDYAKWEVLPIQIPPSKVPNIKSPLPRPQCMLEWFLGTAVSILLHWRIPRFLLQLH